MPASDLGRDDEQDEAPFNKIGVNTLVNIYEYIDEMLDEKEKLEQSKGRRGKRSKSQAAVLRKNSKVTHTFNSKTSLIRNNFCTS